MNLTLDGQSDYDTSGTPDVYTAVSDGANGTEGVAAHINGNADAITKTQRVLGNALTLKGAAVDLASRLAVMLAPDGAFRKGTSFPANPIDGQGFYRTDLDTFYLYDAASGSWKAGFDSVAYALLDGTRYFSGNITIKKSLPALRLIGQEINAKDLQIREDAGVLHVFANTGTEVTPTWTSIFSINLTTAAIISLLLEVDKAYKLTGSGTGKAIFSNANTADRTYTLPNSSDTLVGRNTTDTLTNKTLTSPVITGNTVGTAAIKTATGSSGFVVTTDFVLNDFAFFPSITSQHSAVAGDLQPIPGVSDPANTVARFRATPWGNGSGSFESNLHWRYVTASDDPTIWVAFDPGSGKIVATWASDDPTPGDLPGVHCPGMTSLKMRASDLEHLSDLNAKAQDATNWIRERKMREEHVAYRALQLVAQSETPGPWLLRNCELDLATRKLKVVRA